MGGMFRWPDQLYDNCTEGVLSVRTISGARRRSELLIRSVRDVGLLTCFELEVAWFDFSGGPISLTFRK